MGAIVTAWDDGEGIPLTVRNRVIGLLWLSLLFSAWLLDRLGVTITLFIVGCCVTYYLMNLPIKQDQVASFPDERH